MWYCSDTQRLLFSINITIFHQLLIVRQLWCAICIQIEDIKNLIHHQVKTTYIKESDWKQYDDHETDFRCKFRIFFRRCPAGQDPRAESPDLSDSSSARVMTIMTTPANRPRLAPDRPARGGLGWAPGTGPGSAPSRRGCSGPGPPARAGRLGLDAEAILRRACTGTGGSVGVRAA